MSAEQKVRRGSIFNLDPSKRCEPSAYLFTKAVKFFLVNGYAMAKDIDESDIILVNTCCVTQDKIATSRAALGFARANGKGKRIVLFGCMASLPFPWLEREDLICVGPKDLGELDTHFAQGTSVNRISAPQLPPALRALENVQDARIAEHAADAIFFGITSAAVNLQCVVGIGPGNTCGEQLGHARFDIAAPVHILFPRGEIGQLARDHGLKTDFMRVRAFPFTPEVDEFVRQHDPIFVVEMNRDGQLHQLLSLANPEAATRLHSVAYGDGMPASAKWVREGILAKSEKNTSAPDNGAKGAR